MLPSVQCFHPSSRAILCEYEGTMRAHALAAIAALTVLTAANAQDTRNVTEPVIPSSCTVVTASLSAVDGNKTLAAPDETKLDTSRIQAAIDHCPKGQAVELKADGVHNAFLSGPLDLRTGSTLLIDANVILFGSRNPRDYDLAPGGCGIVAKTASPGCKALISGSQVDGAAVMGQGTVDGRGWAKLIGQDVTWWELAEQARAGGNQHCPRLIVLSHSNNFTLYKVTLRNSGNFHVVFGSGDGFTAWGVIINTPKNARNTDGIDPSAATNVTITHCYIYTGDDNVAIKAGGHVSHMTIAHNHFYAGHGMSIGSETNGGADTIRVTDLSIDGADNGLRIKSNSTRGGPVRDVVYSDVCIRNTKNPIYMDSDYEHAGKAGTRVPSFTGIELHNVTIEGGGKLTLQGFDEQHRLEMMFDNVYFAPSATSKIMAEHADLKMGPGAVNFKPSGEDVTLEGSSSKGTPQSCRDKFVPMPAN
jgi:polygalacturonase